MSTSATEDERRMAAKNAIESLSSIPIPDESEQNDPIERLGQQIGHRAYNRADDLLRYAEQRYRANGKGITYKDLIKAGFAKTKAQAQRIIKYLRGRGQLFNWDNKKPRQYYPATIRAEIIQSKGRRNVPTEGTWVGHSAHPLANTIEQQHIQNIEYVIAQLKAAPASMHKLHLRIQLSPQCYADFAHTTIDHNNKGKISEHKIDNNLVTYTIYPVGTLAITVSCTKTPFRLETEDDITTIMAYIGQVKDRLAILLSNSNGSLIPPVHTWVLSQCDINRDVPIDDVEQLTLPDMQLKYASRVFRLYVKAMGDYAVYRIEEAATPNTTIIEALETIRQPRTTERMTGYQPQWVW